MKATVGKDGVSPIHLATFRGSAEIVKLLINNGAPVDTKKGDDCRTPLHIASMKNCIEVKLKFVLFNDATGTH